MPARKNKKPDYQTLNASKKNGAANAHDQPTLKPPANLKSGDNQAENPVNPNKR